MLNTSNDFIHRYIERVTHVSRKISSAVAVRGDRGVAGEGRVVGVPKLHSCGKYTMLLKNINSDWMSNLPLAYALFILYYAGPLSCILGCNIYAGPLTDYMQD